MKILELYAGSRSFSKVAETLGFETFTTDIKALESIDYVCDILDFKTEFVPFIPDIIWASPDCAVWSKSAGNIHFNTKSLKPKTDKAIKAFEIIEKTLEIIFHFLEQNPNLKYYIENPQGKLSKHLRPGTLFCKIPRLVKIDQCQYGREFLKTTHIFTNDLTWKPRRRCKGLRNCHHLPNIENSIFDKNTNLDKLQYYKRAYIPSELCLEILTYSTEKTIKP